MMWRWFNDWRERRATMRDLARAQRSEEDELNSQIINPFSLSMQAVREGDLVRAAAHWDEAKRRMPKIVSRSREGIEILRALERYDEIEAMVDEGMRRFQPAPYLQAVYAEVAEWRGDHEEAARRWQRNRYAPDEMVGDFRTALCFKTLGRLSEAAAMLKRASRREPTRLEPLIELARISELTGDWVEARARWRALINLHNLPLAIAREAWAMMELGELDAAETALERILSNNSRDFDIAVTRAHLAERRGDLPAACERWEVVRRINIFHPIGHHEGARCLFLLQRHEEADAVMRYAIELFPHEAWARRGYAHLAHDRQEWSTAADRWLDLRQRFPEDQIAVSMGSSALRAAGREDEAAALDAGS